MLIIYRSNRFKRSFKKTSINIRKNFLKQIKIFYKNPFSPILKTHKLKGGLGNYYALCLQNGFRVLFEFIDSDTVLLVNIGSHDDYKKWNKQ